MNSSTDIRLAAGLAPEPIDEAAYIDGLSDAEWQGLTVKLHAFARYLRVPHDKIDDLVQATVLLERDPATRTWNRTKCPRFLAHLRRRFANERWKSHCKAQNRTAPLPEDPDDPVYASKDAVGASPERRVASLELLRTAARLLHERAEGDPVERGILRLRAQGINVRGEQAQTLRVSVAELDRATARLATKANAIARELGFENTRNMLAGARPGVRAEQVEVIPGSTGIAWAWAFFTSYLGGAAMALVAVWLAASGARGAIAGAFAASLLALGGFAGSYGAYVMWLYASWRTLPEHARHNQKGEFVGDLSEAIVPLFVPGWNLFAMWRLTGDLAEALSRTVRRGGRKERVSKRLARVAFVATLVVAPLAPVMCFAWMLAAEPAKRALLALRSEGHPLRYITGGDEDPSWEYWVDVEEGLREEQPTEHP